MGYVRGNPLVWVDWLGLTNDELVEIAGNKLNRLPLDGDVEITERQRPMGGSVRKANIEQAQMVATQATGVRQPLTMIGMPVNAMPATTQS